MKKFTSLIASICFITILQAQNVGIGTNIPIMPLHISKPADTAMLLLENQAALNTNTNVGAYFKNGLFYTGAIKTIGNNGQESRLSFFSFASQNRNNLLERMSIQDDGNIGIGTIAPIMKLHVSEPVDSAVLLMENQRTLTAGTNVGLYFKNGTRYTGALKTTGTGSNSARLGLYTYTGVSTTDLKEQLSILDNGYVGINTNTPTATLDVNGTFKLRGNGAGTGKILSSDANGQGTWIGPVAFSTYLSPNGNGYINIAPNSSSAQIFTNTDYETNSGSLTYNPNVFTAPVSGIYHFSGSISVDASDPNWELAFIRTSTNAVIKKYGNKSYSEGDDFFHLIANCPFSFDVQLSAGTGIKAVLSNNNYANLRIHTGSENTFLSGHLVR